MVAVAAALGLVMLLRHNDIAYALVLIWALTGIAVRLHETAPILITSLVAASILALAAVSAWIAAPRRPDRSSAPA